MGRPQNQELKETILQELLTQVTKTIKSEVREAINNELTELKQDIQSIKDDLKKIGDLKVRVDEIEKSIQHHSEKVDDVCDRILPTMVSHIEKVTTCLALQSLDLDTHRRKWNLTLHGLSGDAGEKEDKTREKVIALATGTLGITDAVPEQLAACHRLKKDANASIVLRFVDLNTRNKWVNAANKLQNHDTQLSLIPDIPPVLRPLRKQLLKIRKDLPTAHQRKRATIRYKQHWPYVELLMPDQEPIAPSIDKKQIVESVLGFSPCLNLKRASDS